MTSIGPAQLSLYQRSSLRVEGTHGTNNLSQVLPQGLPQMTGDAEVNRRLKGISSNLANFETKLSVLDRMERQGGL